MRLNPAKDHARSTLLPDGSSSQVVKEEDHFDVLFDYVPSQGEGLLYLELRLGTRVLKNGQERSVVYTYLDDQLVGELSPVTGKKFEPTLRHIDDLEKRAVVMATIKGSALSASLTFRAAKSDEVEDSWVRTLPPPAGPFAPESPTYNLPLAYRPSHRELNPPKSAKKAPSGGCALVLLAFASIASAAGAAITMIA